MINTKSQSPILKWISIVISYLFHPLFAPVFLTWVLVTLMPASFASLKQEHVVFLLLRVGYMTAFFPLLTVLLMKGLGFAESIQLKNHKERIVPIMATMIFYFWAYWVVKNDTSLQAPTLLKSLFLGSFWGIILLFMANIFVKVSLHATAIAALPGLLLVLLFVSSVNMLMPLSFAIILAGIVGSSRLYLSAHKASEIWFGYIIGILTQLGAYWYLS